MNCEYCTKIIDDDITVYTFHLIVKHPEKFTYVKDGYQTGMSYSRRNLERYI